MPRDNDREVRPPLAYRLGLFFGRPLGWRWVPDNHLGAVYRMERYRGLRGPGFFRINPFTESVKLTVSLNPDFISTNISSLNTRDAVQLGLEVALAYVFDPRNLPHESAQIFVAWPRNILRDIVADFARSTLLSIVANYYAEHICRGELFQTIEESLKTELTKRLQPLAIRPTFAMVLKVIPPSALQETFTAVANRAAYTHDLSTYEEHELSEVRRRELYTMLSELPGGIRYLNITSGDTHIPPQGDRRPRPRTIRGTSRPISYLSSGLDTDEDEP
ncbi:MAG: hypothetical protein Kow0063_25090 [Anaerolineae bacterium]